MAPFPETEIMTIKRLEVALRKMDFKLLKDGAYKLHEKYHSGFKFEYLDMLKEIFADVSNNPSIPEDVKDILSPTIEDILTSQGVKVDVASSPYESLNQNRVSSLTSLSYSTPVEKEEQKLSAFDAFGADKTEEHSQTFAQSPYSAEPFKEYTPVQNNYINQPNLQVQPQVIEENKIKEVVEEKHEEVNSEINYQENIPETIHHEEQHQEIEKELKSIAIFYFQDSSLEKTKNITKYRKLVSKIQEEHTSINEILGLISEINTQSNTNVSEIKNILDQLKTKENKLSLITNTLSSNLTNLINECELSYGLFESNEEKKLNLLPMFGLTNLFRCCECSNEYLNNSQITPLVLQCPKCKGAMLPSFYSNKANGELNIDYYNNSMVTLANSKVWLLIHPTFDEKITLNLLKSALMVSNQVEEIYIIDKDINIRENYRKMIEDINSNIKVNIQNYALEDFLNSIN
ncbi:MAG: hypothetical protein IJ003_06765 [Candidatus Gastranaerophilales bacterium]|nr:hypothetical protein [Candidatus Gastranaerophilales bacterium]